MENKNENQTPQQSQYQPGDKYEIPAEGSLGLLALGHIGLKLWREKRDLVASQKKYEEAKKNNETSTEENTK